MLKYNGSILKVSNGASVIGSITPSYTLIYSYVPQISASTYKGTTIPWTDYNVILFKFNCWFDSTDCRNALAWNPPNDTWRVGIRRKDGTFGTNKFAIEKGGWFSSATIDDSNVVTSSAWGGGAIFYTIPATVSDSSNEFRVIVDRTTNTCYLYLNGVLKFHQTSFNMYDTNMYAWAWQGTSYMKDIYFVGCQNLQTAVNFTP